MKTLISETSPVIADIEKWISAPSPTCSLVLGAACNCDLPAIEKSVCQLLNRVRGSQDYRYQSLDYEDIRFIAGQPRLRNMIAERSGIDGNSPLWSDTDLVARGLASVGGLVLGGQAALDATHRLPNVCRIMLCGCEVCRESDLHATVDQETCDAAKLPSEVILCYLDWMAGNRHVVPTEVLIASEAGEI